VRGQFVEDGQTVKLFAGEGLTLYRCLHLAHDALNVRVLGTKRF
jgi:hypothetical protein